MLRNQKGFTYPLTLCLLILLSTALTIQIGQYIGEKRMLNETENILKQDYYFLSTIEWLQFQLALSDPITTTGSLDYKDGQVSYTIVELSEKELEIKLALTMKQENGVIAGSAFYDKELGKIVKWDEVN
jgi:ComG operon protein 7 (ComGG)